MKPCMCGFSTNHRTLTQHCALGLLVSSLSLQPHLTAAGDASCTNCSQGLYARRTMDR